MTQKIIILDFGSQTTQLIGRRVRELDTFCEILPYNKFPKDDPSVIGVILSGSPYSVHDPEAFKVDLSMVVPTSRQWTPQIHSSRVSISTLRCGCRMVIP